MDYPAALAWLYGTQWTGIKLGLETIRRLIDALGGQPPGARFVHVAGTNGKGSVCALADAVCRAAGWRTGLFTSPHLLTFRERIRVDGLPITEAGVADGLTRLSNLAAGWETAPTFFEITTALALDWFARERAEVIVWETGLGGRLDATNAVTPAVCVLTSIGLDHCAMLGDTLEAVAGEKAGILKAGVPAVSAPQEPAAALVIAREAAARGAALRVINAPPPADWPVGLPGSHQRLNAALALAALDAADIAADDDARRRGLAGVEHPGRFQRLESGRIVLDGAHNPAAARRLARTWAEEFGADARATLILGILRDKDAAGICRELAPLAVRCLTVTTRSPRALSAGELREIWAGAAPDGGVGCRAASELLDALTQAREAGPEPILIAGSLFLVGEALALLTGQTGDPQTSAQ